MAARKNVQYNRRVVEQIAEHLGNYVYLLVDPRDGRPFYAGKGQGSRMLSHRIIDARDLSDDRDDTGGRKTARLGELRGLGLEAEIWVVRRNLGPAYTAVEAAVIDVLQTFPVSKTRTGRLPLMAEGLTNRIRGAGTESGLERLDDIVRELAAPDLVTETPLLLITLGEWEEDEEQTPGGTMRDGRGFKREWTNPRAMRSERKALADSTRCWWTGLHQANVESAGIKHAVAVYGGVTRAVFRIRSSTWVWDTRRGRRGSHVTSSRSGAIFDEVVGVNGHRLLLKKRGEQATYRYWPYT